MDATTNATISTHFRPGCHKLEKRLKSVRMPGGPMPTSKLRLIWRSSLTPSVGAPHASRIATPIWCYWGLLLRTKWIEVVSRGRLANRGGGLGIRPTTSA